MTRVIAICGPSGSGKTTVGQQVAKRLGYLHWEMSDHVVKEKQAFDIEHAELDLHDFVEQVVWATGDYAVAASDLVAVLRKAREFPTTAPRGIVVTGARRREEIDALLSAELPTVLVYLEVPFAIRWRRVRKRGCRGGRAAVDRAEFLVQTRREAGWGLLVEHSPEGFISVSNAGTTDEAAAAIMSLAHEETDVEAG